ncbi:SDR family oxidoreductase [Methylobacterium sp.]|uniref:NAD-dependent epimerase/dehydratase family protein n=1 Tax=Methylobacterium sp. TaxID=409 RepID=UPI000FAEEFC4|nr:SDR family oxidoreductase [Methylobacterium sp.]RUP18588.1 MAG: SDR family oxidoreductase [Methylobacterium sp.]
MRAQDQRKPVLITGARGYLGGCLVRHLDARGIAVLGTSRSAMPPPSGWPSAVALMQLDPLGNLADATAVLAGIDTVIHLAAANESRSASAPDEALTETGAGTRRLLEAAIAAGVRRFIFLSTIHVYGTPLRGLLSETDRPRPVHPYAITHHVGEAFTLAARDAGRIEGAIVRLSNVVGAPAWIGVDRWTLLGNDLARQAFETGALVIRTSGQWRDFITMRDTCQALEQISAAPAEALHDGIINLGSGTTCTVDAIAARVARVAEVELGRPIGLRILDAGHAAPLDPPFQLAVDRLRSLGFAPSAAEGLDTALAETVRLIRDGPRREAGPSRRC